jgi:hypothetical protein
MTLAHARCVPRRGRSRPRPPAIPLASPPASATVTAAAIRAAAAVTAAAAAAATVAGLGGPADVDVYGRPMGRPPWMAGQYLALREHQGRGSGVIYLIHFDRPIGDLLNPRGFASHYTGWTLDLPARLVDHAAGRGARLMQVVGEQGIGWQLARIWTGPRARERSLKGSGGAARRCPVCHLTRLGLAPARPADLFAFEVGARAAALVAPPSELPPAVAA